MRTAGRPNDRPARRRVLIASAGLAAALCVTAAGGTAVAAPADLTTPGVERPGRAICHQSDRAPRNRRAMKGVVSGGPRPRLVRSRSHGCSFQAWLSRKSARAPANGGFGGMRLRLPRRRRPPGRLRRWRGCGGGA